MWAGKCRRAAPRVFTVAARNTRGAAAAAGRDEPSSRRSSAATRGRPFTHSTVRISGRGAGWGRPQENETAPPSEGADNMNGAVYISFFQGQLESVLEQVVQLAVQEISKTVGSSLNALLLETAAKEKENNRLQLQLQARESRARPSAEDGDSAAAAKNKAGAERGDGGRTKPEPRGHGAEPAVPIDTRRLEQRGRAVDQLKSVMERVLDFALRELTKIVEASFDDLLLEITKMEKQQAALEELLDRSQERLGGGTGGRDKGRGGVSGRRRGSENDSVSPSGSSEDTREEPAEESKETAPPSEPERPPVLSVSQDWVPILDKVFGQKWCSDIWQVKEGVCSSGRGLSEVGGHHVDLVSAPSVILQPAPSSPQQDPRWTPLEDMEVFSPDDEDPADAVAPPPPGPSPGPPLSPSGRRSSASMLHRLLTLPSQLLDEDEDEAAAAARETLAALATNGSSDQRDELDPPGRSGREDEEEEEEEEEEEGDKGRKKKRRRVWSECEECGRRFSRMSLLKAHRQTHSTGESGAADTSSPSSPPTGAATPLCCSECGKRFSSNTRLHSHIRTQHPENRS